MSSYFCPQCLRTTTQAPPRLRMSVLCLALALGGVVPAFAQQTDERAQVLEQIQQLREQQAEIARLQQDNAAKLRALEQRLGVTQQSSAAVVASAPALAQGNAASTTPTPAASSSTANASAGHTGDSIASRLKFTGDFRVRGQYDGSDEDRPNRNSSQVRGRLGASFAINDLITVGARLVTGDADDPNSTDVQLSNWDDDLDVNLDQAYLQANLGDLKIYGGKMPQPFTRTELVWDGDVNPQGLAATYRRSFANGSAFRANGMFFVVDEHVAGPDSTMLGAQLGYDSATSGAWKFDASAALYDYTLDSVAGADSGDWRTNLLRPDGHYLSDYRLADVILGATYQGLGERWPLRIVGDYVKNTAARVDADSGYGVDLALGRASQIGDWRFTYGFAVTEVDAVLTAFSQDNIGIASNYRLHSLGFDYVPWQKTTLSAIWYHYKPYEAMYAGSNAPDDWLNRFRISLMVSF